MIVEIKGVQFVNKGAELMLHAILERVASEIPEAKFVIEPSSISPYIKRSKLGLFQKLTFARFRIDWGRLLGFFLSKRFRSSFGMIKESEVDVVLDASGLAYSSKWGESVTKKAAKQFKRMRKRGCKIILLPQAFGPFKTKKIEKYMSEIISNSDLIFAREETSYQYLVDISGNSKKIMVKPDFTNLIEGNSPENIRNIENKICIIPNYRMIDKTSHYVSNNYVPYIQKCIECLNNAGEEVFILVHEGDKDLSLANQINEKFDKKISIIKEDDPRIIKGIIGASKGVISSRFHGLVSALSQGVPSLATSWSHKYKLLFADYEFPEGILEVEKINEDVISEKLSYLTEKKKYNKLKLNLKKCLTEEKNKTCDMWSRVFNTIKNN